MKIAVIGSGISGLYISLLLLQKYNNAEITIYEKNNKIGGRIKTSKFDNINIIEGAGVGRFKSDKLLYNLCTNLNVSTNKYTSKPSFVKINPINIKNNVDYLKKHIIYYDRKSYDFRTFGIKVLGYELYEEFVKTIGETDYELEDFIDVLYNYGFEKLSFYSGFEAFSVNWNELLNSLNEI